MIREVGVVRDQRIAGFYGRCARRHLADPASVPYVDVLARRARTGDRRAMGELCEQLGGIAEAASAKHIKLAAFRGLERDDLRQEAMRGMLDGLKTWDPDRAAFRTYAFARARFAVLNAINSAHLVSVPRSYAEAAVNRPGHDKNFTKLGPQTRSAAMRAVQPTASFSGFLQGKDGADGDPEDFDPGEAERGYEEALTRLAVEQVFRRAHLTPYQREAVEAKFGLGEKKIGEFANERGVSNQAVANIAGRALDYLRDRNDAARKATRRMAL